MIFLNGQELLDTLRTYEVSGNLKEIYRLASFNVEYMYENNLHITEPTEMEEILYREVHQKTQIQLKSFLYNRDDGLFLRILSYLQFFSKLTCLILLIFGWSSFSLNSKLFDISFKTCIIYFLIDDMISYYRNFSNRRYIDFVYEVYLESIIKNQPINNTSLTGYIKLHTTFKYEPYEFLKILMMLSYVIVYIYSISIFIYYHMYNHITLFNPHASDILIYISMILSIIYIILVILIGSISIISLYIFYLLISRKKKLNIDKLLNQIKKINYHSNVEDLKQFIFSEDESGQICPICLNNFEENMKIIPLKCKHVLCEKCFQHLTKDNKNYNCPICKQRIIDEI